MKRLFDIVVSACALLVREGISAAGEATMGKFTGTLGQ